MFKKKDFLRFFPPFLFYPLINRCIYVNTMLLKTVVVSKQVKARFPALSFDHLRFTTNLLNCITASPLSQSIKSKFLTQVQDALETVWPEMVCWWSF